MALATIFSARSALCVFFRLIIAGCFLLSQCERAISARSVDFGSVFAWSASTAEKPQEVLCVI